MEEVTARAIVSANVVIIAALSCINSRKVKTVLAGMKWGWVVSLL